MGRRVLLVLAAVLLALLQAGLLSGLPRPLPYLNLPLIMAVLLVTDFRFGEAVLAAAAGGLVLDALSSFPAGILAASLVIAVVVADGLFTRVFTNQSLLAVASLQALVFLVWQGEIIVVRGLRATLLGWSWSEAGVLPAWNWLLTAVLVQTIAAVLLSRLGRRLGRLASSLVIVARPRKG